MSLQVWLPLNKEGEFQNQGLADITITNNGATYDANGKIGGCVCVDSSKKIIFPSQSWMRPTNENSFSISFWINISQFSWIIACGAFECSINSKSAMFRLGNGGSNTINCQYNAQFDTNTWYHFAATWNKDTKEIKLYINGECKSTAISSLTSFNNIFSTINIPHSGSYKFNDFRLYDSALSPKEVREIAKGLVLHYPMNFLEGGYNLITGLVSGGQTTISNNQVSITGTNSDTYFDIITSKPMVSGKSYRISCLGEGFPFSSYYNFPIAGQGNSSIGSLKVKNGYCELQFIANDTCANAGINIILDDARRNPGAGIIKNLELIELDTIYDCSGYCNNGTIIGGLQVADDSPRYRKSTKMNKGQISCLNPISNNIHTVSFWMKTLDWTPSNNNYNVIKAGNYWNIYRDHINPCRYTLNSYSGSQSRYNAIPITNKTEWNHVCTVSTGSQSKIYVNGVLTSTNTVSLKDWGENQFIIGPGYDDCILSDVRLYSTALSDDDIKELYNTSAWVANNGTIAAYELNEE